MEEDLFRKGKIIKFFQQSGYGFIRDASGKQVYFHLDEVRFVGEKKKRSQIKEGMEVGFDVSRTSKGIRATHLKFPISVPPSTPAGTPEPIQTGSPEPEPEAAAASEEAIAQKPPESVPENRPPDKKSD